MRWFLAIAATAVWMASTTAQAQEAAPRSEVPIREVVLSDGARRYTIPIKVGGTAIEAGLDTGSSGLRVLPGVLQPADAGQSGGEITYAYASGARLNGVAGKGVVTIGASAAPITLQLVRTVDCLPRLPRCPASRVPQAQYGIQGDGLPGEGFKAIIGVNMANVDVGTPLRTLGVKRWIVDLPRPGEGTPGRLILNPTDAEVAQYVMFPTFPRFDSQPGGLHDAIPGCLANAAANVKACGPVLLDSGAPGIEVENGGLGKQPWPSETPALLGFSDEKNRPRAIESLSIGLRAHASRLSFKEAESGGGARGTVIYAGLSPYFAFSVLYDPSHMQVGLKPRAQADGGPKGELVAP